MSLGIVWFLTLSLLWLPLNGSDKIVTKQDQLYKRIGCYKDTKTTRALEIFGGRHNHSVDSCYVRCGERYNAKYFGLEGELGKKECWCGDDLKQAKKHGATSCGTTGQPWRLSLYEVKEKPVMSWKGAYRDTSNRAMPFLTRTYHDHAYKRGRCYTRCRRRGYKYFALQNGKECRCSNDWKKSTRYGKDNCGYEGGKWCNYIYEIGIPRCAMTNYKKDKSKSKLTVLSFLPGTHRKIDNTGSTVEQSGTTREVENTSTESTTAEFTSSSEFTLSAGADAFGVTVEAGTSFGSSNTDSFTNEKTKTIIAPAQPLVVPPGKCLVIYVYFARKVENIEFTYDIECEDGTKKTGERGTHRREFSIDESDILDCDDPAPHLGNKMVKVAFIGISGIVLLSGLLYGLRRHNKYNDNYEMLETKSLKENDDSV